MDNKDKAGSPDMPQYEFHYSREERLSMMPDSVLEFKKKKRKNRSLLILWLDIALIVILSSGFLIYQKITGGKYTDKNYTFSMMNYVYNDNLLISVTAVNNLKSGSSDKSDTEIPVILTVKLSRADEFYKKIFDVLPDKNTPEKTYRISIPLSEIPELKNSTHILASIKYENSSINIKHKIVYEK